MLHKNHKHYSLQHLWSSCWRLWGSCITSGSTMPLPLPLRDSSKANWDINHGDARGCFLNIFLICSNESSLYQIAQFLPGQSHHIKVSRCASVLCQSQGLALPDKPGTAGFLLTSPKFPLETAGVDWVPAECGRYQKENWALGED